MNKLLIFTVAITLISLVGCGEDIKQSKVTKHTESLCHQAWFEQVEQQIVSGDGQGHGPDLGSMEWRSVVEFKLGIRGQAGLPAKDSQLWCDYIDSHYIENP
ncbi:hypothetical protein [Shewanella pneumatophori]|uniref:hypothetical protein n=1 Tax=Shewanella pneumatophori TaxID=314092 RepID=UPI003B835D54